MTARYRLTTVERDREGEERAHLRYHAETLSSLSRLVNGTYGYRPGDLSRDGATVVETRIESEEV
jgi:hypothetical protein